MSQDHVIVVLYPVDICRARFGQKIDILKYDYRDYFREK
jgi:hypothetical protein